MKNEHKYIGKSFPRIDGPAKVTGTAEYVHEMKLPGMLYARILKSPHASAKIKSIDTKLAKKMPGVKAVITGKELNYKVGLYMIDKEILARDVVRYQGEPVAAVAAVDELTAEKACELINVEYEISDPVLDVMKAAKKNSALVHPDLKNYSYMKGVFDPQPNTNIPHWQKIRKGNMKKGWEEADLIVENDFWNPPVQHVAMETHTAIARALPENKVEIWTSAQSPFTVRNLLCVCFGLQHKDVRVRIPSVGGGFGGKAGIHLEPLVYCLSKKAGRSVKLTMTREEEFNTIPSRQGLRSFLKTGVKKDGTITAYDAKLYWDAGAYADYGVNIGRAAATASAGPYEVPNCHIDSYVVYTNKIFGTAYRGFGHLEVLWGVERHIDIIAEKLKMDPLEFRLKNALRDGSKTITGERIFSHTGRVDKCLKNVAKEIGWKKNPKVGNWKKAANGKIRGKGIAALHKAPAMPTFTSCSVVIKFNEDASCDLLVSGVDFGQGTYTMLTQVAAEELKLPIEKVNVVWDCDTSTNPYDWQTVASRFAVMGGNATISAAHDAINQIKETAAQVFRCPVHDLSCENGKVFIKHRPDKKLPYEKFVMGYVYPNGNAIGGPVIGRGRFIAQGLTNLDLKTGQGLPALDWTFGAHAVEIEVDVETGEIEIIKIATSLDAGKVLNEQQCYTQTIGGVVQGIGSALHEEFKFDKTGKFLNAGFVDYKIPTAKDLPGKFAVSFVETPLPDGPYGARGIAEHPMISVPGAIGNAFYYASGINAFEFPLTPERVFFMLRNKLPKHKTNKIC